MWKAMPTLTNQTNNLHGFFKVLIGNTAFLAIEI